MQSKTIVGNIFWSLYLFRLQIRFFQLYLCSRESKKMAHLLESMVAGTKHARLIGE